MLHLYPHKAGNFIAAGTGFALCTRTLSRNHLPTLPPPCSSRLRTDVIFPSEHDQLPRLGLKVPEDAAHAPTFDKPFLAARDLELGHICFDEWTSIISILWWSLVQVDPEGYEV
jgi:hypothetical protein